MEDLNNIITHLTGLNELAHVNTFADYLEPPVMLEADRLAVGGGHWSGWTFALCQQTQRYMKNTAYLNLLYTALQLSNQVKLNMSLRGYKDVDSLTIQARPIIDTRVTAYLIERGAQQFPWSPVPAADGVEIHNIQGKHI